MLLHYAVLISLICFLIQAGNKPVSNKSENISSLLHFQDSIELPKFHRVELPQQFDLEGFCPSTLPLQFVLEDDHHFTPAQKDRQQKEIHKQNAPLHVFDEDNRVELKNASYPWSSIGMLVSSRGVCTGTLVGEDIVLTASHCIPWNDDGSIDRIRFLPGFYKKHAPFGYADVKTVYSLTRNGGKINAVQAAFDVSCLKISKKLGKKAGYAGTVQWKREWEERSDWFNVGYPQPEHGFDEGITPLIQEQGNVTFVKEYTIGSLTSYLMKTTFDLTRGHSGGPIFGFFDGEEYPRVAAVVSSENPASKSNPHGRNNLSGGESLSFIVGYARSVSEAENNKEELNAPIDHENMQRNNPKINEKEISNVTLIFKNGKDH